MGGYHAQATITLMLCGIEAENAKVAEGIAQQILEDFDASLTAGAMPVEFFIHDWSIQTQGPDFAPILDDFGQQVGPDPAGPLPAKQPLPPGPLRDLVDALAKRLGRTEEREA